MKRQDFMRYKQTDKSSHQGFNPSSAVETTGPNDDVNIGSIGISPNRHHPDQTADSGLEMLCLKPSVHGFF
jgi:hypothetical protein